MKRFLGLGGVVLGALMMAGCPEDPPTQPPGTDLDPPPAGQGVQFGTGLESVNPGDEVQNCFFFKVSDLLGQAGLDPTKPFNLHRVQVFQREGSHHMNIFRVRTVVPDAEGGLDPAKGPYLNKNGTGGCFKSSNWADWPLIANTQIDGQLDWEFPDGVANKLEPDEILMVQSHYVNATTQKSPEDGQVLINFWHLDDSDVTDEMGTIFATKQSIRVCQSLPTPTFSGGCTVNGDQDATIIGANGHFHSRGKKFDMFTWDGETQTTPPESERFYESTAWDEPPMAHGDNLATMPKGGGVFYTCEYEWTPPPDPISCADLNAFDQTKYKTPEEQLDCCYTFGPVVDRNEHCNIFVYYYPKTADVTCF